MPGLPARLGIRTDKLGSARQEADLLIAYVFSQSGLDYCIRPTFNQICHQQFA